MRRLRPGSSKTLQEVLDSPMKGAQLFSLFVHESSVRHSKICERSGASRTESNEGKAKSKSDDLLVASIWCGGEPHRTALVRVRGGDHRGSDRVPALAQQAGKHHPEHDAGARA